MNDTNPEKLPPQDGGGASKGSRKLVIVIVAAVVGLSVLGWLGSFIMGKVVGFGARKAFEAGTGVKIDERGGSMTITGEDGAEIRVSGDDEGGTVTYKTEAGEVGRIESRTGDDVKSLPKDFPADFPVLPGSELTDTFTMSQAGQGQNFSLTWTTDKTPEQVVSFYEDNLAGQGWQKAFFSAFDETTMLLFERAVGADDAKDSVTLSIERKDGLTEVILTMLISAR